MVSRCSGKRFQHGSVITKIAQKVVVCDVVAVVHAVTRQNNLLRSSSNDGENKRDGVSMKMTFVLSIIDQVTGLYTQ